MTLQIDERRGFEWWTIGWGKAPFGWVKLGPITLARWTDDVGQVLELHCCNRLLTSARIPTRSSAPI